MQPVQDLSIEDRVSRTQYQYSIEDADANELSDWAPRLEDKLGEAAAIARRRERRAGSWAPGQPGDRPRYRLEARHFAGGDCDTGRRDPPLSLGLCRRRPAPGAASERDVAGGFCRSYPGLHQRAAPQGGAAVQRMHEGCLYRGSVRGGVRDETDVGVTAPSSTMELAWPGKNVVTDPSAVPYERP